MGTFDEADIQKAYAHIRRKLQALAKTEYPPGIDIAPSNNPSITSFLTLDDAIDDDASLLGGSSLAIDPAVDDVSLLG